MKGLFIKDLMLMKMQKRFFALIIGIALIMGFSTGDSVFVIGYMTFIIPFFSVSTISYDEFDGGCAFLFTLPVTRKMYVIEKYIFSLLLGFSALILSILFSALININNISASLEALYASPLIFAIMVSVISLMLPLHLKFGAERARIVTFIIGGAVFIIGRFLALLLESTMITGLSLFSWIFELDIFILLIFAISVSAILLLISAKISISVMNKKEF